MAQKGDRTTTYVTFALSVRHPTILGSCSAAMPKMIIIIVVIGAVTALAMFAILWKLSTRQPKKAEKLEKGDILKQLLALSELEEGGGKPTPRPARVEKASQVPKSPPPKAIGRTSCAT
jgi:hypothetical protein